MVVLPMSCSSVKLYSAGIKLCGAYWEFACLRSILILLLCLLFVVIVIDVVIDIVIVIDVCCLLFVCC